MEIEDPPKIFTRKIQQVFEHIWNNPGVTTRELLETFWPNAKFGSNITSVTMSHIRHGLHATDYRLVAKFSGVHNDYAEDPRGRTLLAYKIAYRIRPQPDEGTKHGTV